MPPGDSLPVIRAASIFTLTSTGLLRRRGGFTAFYPVPFNPQHKFITQICGGVNGRSGILTFPLLQSPLYYLANNKSCPEIIDDMRHSFETLAAQQDDIFIANKGERFSLSKKMAKLNEGDKNAFIDEHGLQRYVKMVRENVENQLKKQSGQRGMN